MRFSSPLFRRCFPMFAPACPVDVVDAKQNEASMLFSGQNMRCNRWICRLSRIILGGLEYPRVPAYGLPRLAAGTNYSNPSCH